MRPEDAKKLLGGFATGTLTDAEEQALYAAAMEDQDLFDALANEQGLRDLLRDPAAKARLLAALDVRPRVWWWSWKPAAVLAMAGVAAVAVVVGTRQAPEPVALVAKVEAPRAPAAAPAPAPAVERRAAVAEARQVAEPASPAKRTASEPPRLNSEPPSESTAAAKAELAGVLKQVADAASPPQAPKAAEARDTSASAAVSDRARGGVAGGVVGGVRQGGAPQAAPERADVEAPKPMQAFADAGPSARVLFLGNAQQALRVQSVAAQPAAVQPLGLRYSIVRGDAGVTVRFTANVNGYLSLDGAAPVALTTMQPYTPPAIAGDEVRVIFARQPQVSVPAQVAPVTETIGNETYVVNGSGGPLVVTIPLKSR
jgi:hypothetical protein